MLKFEQSKTAGRSKSSNVVTPLSPMLQKIIGEPEVQGDYRQLIFSLPTWATCVKQLKVWVKDSGIGKHMTWHCACRSFAVNLLNGGANIKTVQSLMGHASIEITEKYLCVVDELQHKAINSLPEFDY